MLLNNKTAVITGCNRGIGFSILENFAKNGANIIACVRKSSQEFEKTITVLSKKYGNKIDIVKFQILKTKVKLKTQFHKNKKNY